MFSPHTIRADSPAKKAAALLALGGIVFFLGVVAAQAEDPVTGRYATGDRARDVYFDPSVPGGKFRTAIVNAAGAWNKLPGVALFNVHKSPTMALDPDPCARVNGVPVGGILRGPVAGSTLAENRSCVDLETGRLIGFRQTYNTRFRFYTGKGNPPRTQYDLQGVATHELGHAEGWTGDHYGGRNNSSLCADKSKQATMCPIIYPGSKRLHTLTQNDKAPVVESYSESPIAPVDPLAELGLRAPAASAFSSAVAPGGAGARGCLLGLLARLHLSRGGEVFAGGAGRQLVDLAAGADYGLGKGGDDCVVGGSGADDLRPGPGNDTVIGGPGPDVIGAGPGADLILGGRGADQIYALDGTFDRIRCGSDDLRADPLGQVPDPVPDRVYLADPGDVLVDCEMAPSDFKAIPLPPGYERARDGFALRSDRERPDGR